MTNQPIPFIDLAAQRARLGRRIDDAIAQVLHHGKFILGPEVRELEEQLEEFGRVRHAVGCANGTDALLMALMARGIGRGDAVFVPSFTFASTAEVVALAGATPVFVDVDENTFTMDPASLAAAIDACELVPRAVITVDLFGQPADYDTICGIAARSDLWVLADAAQSFGATWNGRSTASLGDIAATSFFPAKPLGCYGDGGAVFTDDDDTAAILRSIRVHGKGSDKYDNVRIGLNGRLDTIQAAILIQKLAIFRDELERRGEVAGRYTAGLSGAVEVPVVRTEATSTWAQYTIKLDDRDRVAAALRRAGIPTAVYYPRPLHRQTAYAGFPTAPGGLPASGALADRVLSLPLHPYLEPPVQDRIIAGVLAAVGAAAR